MTQQEAIEKMMSGASVFLVVIRWWRHPIKWYQWRKVIKVANRNTKFILQTIPPEKQK